MSKIRADKVSKLLRQIVSEAITFKWRNPHAPKVTVQRVQTTDNIRSVKVFVSIMGEKEARPEILAALADSVGFFKQEIGHQAQLRFVPELKFILDETLDKYDRINELLRQAKTDEDRNFEA